MSPPAMSREDPAAALPDHSLAVVGMACRFPGARDVEEFWRNLRAGVESVTFFTDADLRAAGVDAAALGRPDYVKANAVLAEADGFDPDFFGYTLREAELIDPQQRVFLECAWTALEHAGCDPSKVPGVVGVFAGAGPGTYLLRQLAPNPAALAGTDGFAAMIANDKDFLSTRVAYKLNLRGPSIAVQSACSTSLVAVHLAGQSLLAGECDVALAGGVSVRFPQTTGYVHHEGMILSPDGHCRAFDARAAGIVGGNGAGVVVLKRLEDAQAAGDTIHAVIRGSAVNNDGADKVGYTAPSVSGQEAVIKEALAVAGVAPDTIGYVEAHGTGTALGDPIEVTALTRAFRRGTERRQYCVLGSVKTNIGHLDTAAGVAGLIKTVLVLSRREIPQTLHFAAPNPQIDFSSSPFRVSSRLEAWPEGLYPRRAGVSSFGLGGTNAHVVLEEPPAVVVRMPSSDEAQPQLLTVSARTGGALLAATANLASHLQRNPELDLADVAWTLATGRREFLHRRSVVARSSAEAAELLMLHQVPGTVATSSPAVAFLFPGQGSQYPGMAAAMYRSAHVFRAEVDRCAAILRTHRKGDVRELIFANATEEGAALMERTAEAQVALFTVEYCLARQWIALGVLPRAMLGHSIGEWVAACLSGVFTLEEALRLVVTRGRLMEAQPPGAMLAVSRPEAELRQLLERGIAVAAVNAPDQTVCSGTVEAILKLERILADRGVASMRLKTSHANHSTMMEPAARAFAAEFAGVPRRAPSIRWISNVTGTWITEGDAADPAYWSRQMLATVRFADGLEEVLRDGSTVLLEVGPGRALTGLATRLPGWMAGHAAIPSMRHGREGVADGVAWLRAAGRLWDAGVTLDWKAMNGDASRRRVPLPTYAFDRQRCWIETVGAGVPVALERSDPMKRPDLADWFYLPSWRRTLAPCNLPAVTDGAWLVIADAGGLAEKFAGRLRAAGAAVDLIDRQSDAAARLAVLSKAGRPPRWLVSFRDVTESVAEEPAYADLVALAQTLASVAMPVGARLTVIANGLQSFAGEQPLHPAKALLHGPARVLQTEAPGLAVRVVDVLRPATDAEADILAERLLSEARSDEGGAFAALRRRDRWTRTLEPVNLGPSELTPLRERGVYLITGGMGGIGLVLAGELTHLVRARLVLVGRTAPDAATLAQLAKLEAAGAEVMTAPLDVADEPALLRLREDVRRRWGKIDGIIHSAGVSGGRALAGRAPHDGAAILSPKVAGTLALDRVFGSEPLDFFALMSSLTAQLGEFGQTDYAAANAFLDAFAEARHAAGAPMVSISWDAWRDTGMAFRFSQTAGLTDWNGQQRPLRITDEEGVEIFRRALSSGAAHLVVSTHELAARMSAAASANPHGGAILARRGMQSRPELSTAFVAPSNAIDQEVAALFTDLLGVGPVGIHDNFFELGGHSLLATQVIARLMHARGAALTLPDFFATPTVAGLSGTLAERAAHGSMEPALRRVARSGMPPLSYQQQAMWLVDRLAGQSAHMNELGAQSIRGPLDEKRLLECFNEVVRRHDVLRTRFVERGGEPAQEIIAVLHVDMPVIDAARKSGPAQDAEVRRLAAELVAEPFDLARGPLLRVQLVRCAAEHHVLIVVVHHIVFDGWSAGVLFGEMLAFYGAAARGAEPKVATLPIQYADFAVWQRDWLQGERRGLLEAFWKNHLAGSLPLLALPTDRPRPPVQTFRGERLAVAVDATSTRRLEILGRSQGASLFMTLLAAYGAMIGRYAGQDEIIVGCPVASRDRKEIEPLIGFFVNPLPVRLDLCGNPTFNILLARVRDTMLEVFANQALPFELIVEAVRPQRNPSRHDLFQTIFVFQNAAPAPPTAEGLTVAPLEFSTGPARSDLDFYLWETSDGLRGHIIFNAELFEVSSIARLLQRWEALVGDIVEDPSRPIGALGFDRRVTLPSLVRLASVPTASPSSSS